MPITCYYMQYTILQDSVKASNGGYWTQLPAMNTNELQMQLIVVITLLGRF